MTKKANKQATERVRLATEVIARLDAGSFDVAPVSVYYMPSKSVCRVCAVAALAVACCGVDELIRKGDCRSGQEGARNMLTCLSPLFSAHDLAEIEAAYEIVEENMPMLELAGMKMSDVEAFTELYPGTGKTRTERLRAIMANIIEHDGEFRP